MPRHNIGEYLALLFGRHPGSMSALARVSRAEAYTHTVKWIGTCEACERHRDPERHRTQPRTSFIELPTTEPRASEALNRNATRRHLIRRCPRGDTGTAADATDCQARCLPVWVCAPRALSGSVPASADSAPE